MVPLHWWILMEMVAVSMFGITGRRNHGVSSSFGGIHFGQIQKAPFINGIRQNYRNLLTRPDGQRRDIHEDEYISLFVPFYWAYFFVPL